MSRHPIALVMLVGILSACGSQVPLPDPTRSEPEATSAVPSTGPTTTADATPIAEALVTGLPIDLPIDQTLIGVSRSNPAPAAQSAMDACLRSGEIDAVIGMAQLPAREVRRFMLTNGNEPELQGEQLVWAVQLKGDISYRGRAITDPLCVVLANGRPVIFAPYGQAGERFTPPEGFIQPTVALPPLLP